MWLYIPCDSVLRRPTIDEKGWTDDMFLLLDGVLNLKRKSGKINYRFLKSKENIYALSNFIQIGAKDHFVLVISA